jgi:hypothetical protein
MLDLNARQAIKIKVVPKEALQDAMTRLHALFEEQTIFISWVNQSHCN